MGLTKQYLAYRPIGSFNIIVSGRSNVNFVTYDRIEGRYVAAAAAENVIIWDLRLGERVLTLCREKVEVTALRASPDHLHIAIGYADGFIEIFDMTAPEHAICSLALHKHAISVIRYDKSGIRLVTGGLDTELVVVDVVEQAGQHRLIGHNAAITDAHFLEHLITQNVLVSCSKDTQIKFWNLETQFCFKTIVDNRTEIWALVFVGNLMIAGASESEMNVYRLKKRDTDNANQTIEAAVEGLSIDEPDAISPLIVNNCGVIQRASKGRTVNLITDPYERIVSCHGTNDLIENFYICTEEETIQRLKKRLKKTLKTVNVAEIDTVKELSLSDQIKRLESIKTKQKIKSLDMLLGANNEVRILVSLANNSLALYALDTTVKKKASDSNSAVKLLRTFTRVGHQSEVRALCFSNDSLAIASGSAESFKFWNRETMQCLRTVTTDYILCACFVPGDRYALCGMKSGKLLIIDVGAADIIEVIPAHTKELWSVTLLTDQKGCVTGAGDNTVKLWLFSLIDVPDKGKGIKELSLLHKSTLKLRDVVLSVAVQGQYIAIGMLDSTVQIIFLDTFKEYLNLYGHKLSVLCLDISDDANIIATGSADRNIKIWSLHYGECRRSLFAHDDSVMALKFIPKTHMFFTCGKDGRIKQWDGDTFDKIITLPGHIGEAYNLAISPNGRFLITCGSDRTLRLFERTDEPLVLQDVQEEEREEFENQQLATGEESVVPLLPGLKLPSRKTVGSEKAAESILECLEICKQYEADQEFKKPQLHPLMRALQVENPVDFLLSTLSRIRSSDLEESLLLLPFANVCELLERLPKLIEARNDEIELLCKVTVFLFKVHMKPIISSKTLKPLLERLVAALKRDINALRDVIGLNLHSLMLLQHEIEQQECTELFREATLARHKREKKRREAAKRTFIQMS